MQLVSIICMEAAAADSHNEGKYSRKLDLSAPLLSARRPTTSRIRRLIHHPNTDENRIPFSWEESAGRPKDNNQQASHGNGLIWPVPKPPPGCQGDRELLYSDALDVSLSSESFSSDNTADSNNNNNNNNSYKTRRNMFSRADDLEPGDLIFLRFLKDAKALATDPLVNGGQPESSFARALDGRQVYCESLTSCTGKACGGWDISLPWRVKPEAPDSGRLRNSLGVVASSRVVDASLGHYC